MFFAFIKKIYPGSFLFVSLLFFLTGCESNKTYKVASQFLTLKTPKGIIPVKDSLVVPVIYTNTVSFKSLAVAEKKSKFIDFILPSVLVVKHDIEQEQSLVKALKEKKLREKKFTPEDSILMKDLLKKYHSKNLDELEMRIKPHPTSIVLAQAAIESGWGTSHFFIRGNNVFGVWANSQTKEKIKATSSRKGKAIFVKKYLNISHSIRDYYLTLATTRAYDKFRRKRMVVSNPYTLSRFLNSYSETGSVYTKKIRSIIRENNLKRFDTYKIDPQFLEVVTD